MSGDKRGVKQRARHKRVLSKAKGYYGRRKNVFRVAKQAVERAMQYQTRDRKVRKRTFRALWIQRINAAVRSIDESLHCPFYTSDPSDEYTSGLPCAH